MPRIADLVQIGFNPTEAKHLAVDYAVALTATGNNSQANAYLLTAQYVQFTTATSTTNSVKLPLAISSAYGEYIVRNDTAVTLYIFPSTGDSINNLAANTAIALAPYYTARFNRISDTSYVAMTAASGTAGTGQTEIDFGSTPIAEQSFTVTQFGMTSSSNVICQQAYKAATGRDLDENEMDSLDLKAVAGSGQFTLYAKAIDGSYLADNYVINYSWG